MPRPCGLRSFDSTTRPGLAPAAREVVIAVAAALLPGVRLGRGDEVTVQGRLPETALGREVLEKGTDAGLTLAHRMVADRQHLLGGAVIQRALEVLAVDGEVQSRGHVHGAILRHATALEH